MAETLILLFLLFCKCLSIIPNTASDAISISFMYIDIEFSKRIFPKETMRLNEKYTGILNLYLTYEKLRKNCRIFLKI